MKTTYAAAPTTAFKTRFTEEEVQAIEGGRRMGSRDYLLSPFGAVTTTSSKSVHQSGWSDPSLLGLVSVSLQWPGRTRLTRPVDRGTAR